MDPDGNCIEKRWGTRLDLGVPAELKSAEGLLSEVSLRDASLSGAFVETSNPLPLHCCVAVRPLGRTSEWIDACIMRTQSSGVAIEWLDPGSHAAWTLLAPESPDVTGRRRGEPGFQRVLQQVRIHPLRPHPGATA
jgi:hypothetical protein